MLPKWDSLPEHMKTEEVRAYYDILMRKKNSLLIKRGFDIVLGACLLLILAVPMMVLSVLIKLDSVGPVFYRQKRITTCGKEFRIHKFRTMVQNADKIGSAVTVNGDARITKIGAILRRYRLDEIPQLIDVLVGDMTFVGTRPEAVKYVEQYSNEMKATLLLPAGITSEASIRYKNEALLLDSTDDVDGTYVEHILPEKMKYNLEAIKNFSLLNDLFTMVRTVFAVLGKQYK